MKIMRKFKKKNGHFIPMKFQVLELLSLHFLRINTPGFKVSKELYYSKEKHFIYHQNLNITLVVPLMITS
jgi:uncharacterized membrane protein